MFKQIISTLACFSISFITWASQAVPSSTSQEYLQAFGWMLGTQANARQLGFTNEEIQEIAKGFQQAAQASPAPACLSTKGFQEYIQNKAKQYEQEHQKEIKTMIETNKKEQEGLFAQLDKNENILKTNNGMYYEILTQGEGPLPKNNDWVLVHYTGKLINGSIFDSSVQRGEPVQFNLEAVIPGFQEGLQLINKKGTIRLYIPPSLGYGDNELPGIPAGSTLVFDVELLDFGNHLNQ